MWQFYPSIGCDSTMNHCAFGFYLLCQLQEASDDLGGQGEEIRSKFPRAEKLRNGVEEQVDDCNRFTGLKEVVSYRDFEEGNVRGAVIEHRSVPFAPNLGIMVRDCVFLDSSLHNCATPNLAVVMNMHGLSALREIYSAYGIEPSFLPRIYFEEGDLMFDAPFRRQVDSRAIDFLSRNIAEYVSEVGMGWTLKPFGSFKQGAAEMDVEDGKFVGRVKYSRKHSDERNRVAAHLFNLAVGQAKASYLVVSP